jgi:thiol-disulfide isomerase/thioredoxin
VDLIDQPLPYFSDTSLTGKVWNPEKLKGKVVLVNFWFIGCMPCMKEIKHFNQLHNSFKDKEFILLSIAPQVKEDLLMFNDTASNIYSDIRDYFDTGPIKYEIIPACIERKKGHGVKKEDAVVGVDCDNIVRDFYVHAYPTTFIIDKTNTIRYVNEGFSIGNSKRGRETMKKYKNIITQLLSK